MESLTENEEQTVPHMARTKSVSRQHIQVNVDALVKAGLVSLRSNPGHKRSPFLGLTVKGRSTFASMRRREEAPLVQIAKEFTLKELSTASDTLMRLKQGIVAVRAKGGTND
jgi:DNA-binding MarR family transcriptional regulator